MTKNYAVYIHGQLYTRTMLSNKANRIARALLTKHPGANVEIRAQVYTTGVKVHA